MKKPASKSDADFCKQLDHLFSLLIRLPGMRPKTKVDINLRHKLCEKQLSPTTFKKKKAMEVHAATESWVYKLQ